MTNILRNLWHSVEGKAHYMEAIKILDKKENLGTMMKKPMCFISVSESLRKHLAWTLGKGLLSGISNLLVKWWGLP